MSDTNPSSHIDPRSGFCSKTSTFHSLRPTAHLPLQSSPTSVSDYVFSLLQSFPPPSPATFPALIDAVTGRRIFSSDFILGTRNLAFHIHNVLGLRKGDTAFIFSPNSIHVPILCLSLLSLGVIVSPANPASSESEILHQINLCKPVIAFVTTHPAHKVKNLNTIVMDSSWFESIMTCKSHNEVGFNNVKVFQSDPAAILYSSGTTGKVKGVILTHRNFTYAVAAGHAVRDARHTPPVCFCAVPFFHVYGLSYSIRALAMGETLVSVGRFDMKIMLRAIQEYRITHMAVAPPVVVAMVKSDGVTDGYDLSSLEVVGCGGAALRKSVVEKFNKKFPYVILGQAYGLTETTARVFGTIGPKEGQVMGATGKLMPNCKAKIVDPNTHLPLRPGSPGEIWLRGPSIMKGYVGDEEATAATLDSEGWLRTGDLCYIDNEGFLYFVDRIKELIKYKGYQVAPAELEHLLHSHPDIAEAAVIPYPDDEAGQVPMAFVVRQGGSTINESQITEFIAKQVAPYKRLRKVTFIDSLPKNAGGKVLRKELINFSLSSPTSKL